jgi:glycosyltransferase involved in cell wall biosynthesis
MGVEQILPLKMMPFPVNTELFKPILDEKNKKNKVFIYFKRRNESELNILENYLRERKIQYEVFDYVKKYEENDYLKTLQEAKFGIVLGSHESQGFALQEAMACNVPLIVWNVTNMNQEVGSNHPSLPATSIPYWDERCGEYFTKWEEWENCFNVFLKNIKTGEKYKPREFIMENLSTVPCAERFMKLLN